MRAPDPPDASELPIDDVRDAFVRGLEGWDDDPEAAARVQRASVLLGRRELATDALSFTLALLDWLRLDVLPGVDPVAAELPPARTFDDVTDFQAQIVSLSADAKARWSDAYRQDRGQRGQEQEQAWSVYQAFERCHRAATAIRSIPKYRHADTKWRAKRPRPTPLSLCEEAAACCASSYLSAVEYEPELDWALERIGLSGDELARSRVARVRRTLQAAGLAAPGAHLISFTDRLTAAADAAPGADPDTLAARALASADATAIEIVADTPALAVEPTTASTETTVAEVATAVLNDLTARLLPDLCASAPERPAVTRGPAAATPAEPLLYRPTPEDLAARLERGVRSGRRKPADALRELRTLGDDVSAESRCAVAAAVIDALDLGRGSYEQSPLERIGVSTRQRQLVPVHASASGRPTHLWPSDPATGDDDAQFMRALCGHDLDTETSARRVFRAVERRLGERYVLDGHPACRDCLAEADRQGLLPETAAAPDEPAGLSQRLIDKLLTLDPDALEDDDDEWDRSEDIKLRRVLRPIRNSALLRQAAEEAHAGGEIAAQRLLGPLRYRKEARSFAGPISAHLSVEDWEQTLDAPEKSLAKTLLEIAHQRQDEHGGSGRAGGAGWDEHFAALSAYKRAHGHVRVPREYETADGLKLGFWLRNQRQALRRSGGRRLAPERLRRLNTLDSDWVSGHAPADPVTTSAAAGSARSRSTGRHLTIVADPARAGQHQPSPDRDSLPRDTDGGTIMVWKGSRTLRDPVYKTRVKAAHDKIRFIGSDRWGGELIVGLVELARAVDTGAGEIDVHWSVLAADATVPITPGEPVRLTVELDDVELRLTDGGVTRFTLRARDLKRLLTKLLRSG